MKPNSCLFRAAQRLCHHQFGIDISNRQSVFDHYNSCEGVLFNDVVPCLNEALQPWGISVVAVHGQVEDFSYPELLRPAGWVDAPLISYCVEQEHAEAIIGTERGNGTAAIKLGPKDGGK